MFVRAVGAVLGGLLADACVRDVALFADFCALLDVYFDVCLAYVPSCGRVSGLNRVGVGCACGRDVPMVCAV